MNDRDKFLRGLSKHRIEQLLALSKTKEAPAPDAERIIERVPRDGDLPVSFAQQRLWFISQFDRKAAHYNISIMLSLRGALDVCALKAAIDAIFVRHETLRSTFIAVQGEPRVRLLDATSRLPLTIHDLRSHEDAGVELDEIRRAESAAPFDLTVGPLMRAHLIHLGDENHALLLSQHHIISDGWSLSILAHEICEMYRAKLSGSASTLPPLAIQYPDYAAWQRKKMTREHLAEHFEYWRTQLAHIPELLFLPLDRSRPARQSTAGALLPIELDAPLTAGLYKLARTHGMSLYMVMLAAWGVVLSRLSGQDDVVIGSPSANRDRLEIEPLIGFFVNMLALRLNLAENPTIAELLAQVRETTLAAQQHQSVPFEQLVEELKPARRLDATPIFQALLAWQNNKQARFDLPGVVVEATPQPLGQVKFDIELSLSEQDQKIVGGISYTSALFHASTIERHRGYLLKTLKAMVDDVSRPLHEIEMLSQEEREMVVSQFNATHAPYERDHLVHELFEEQVRRSSHDDALSYRGQTLSYLELNQRANRIAHHLREFGVKPDDRVAICVPRSFEMVEGLLGILKSGGSYVPVDPNLPRERLAYMLEDCSPRLIVSHSSMRGVLPDTDIPVVWLDTDAELATRPTHDPDRAAWGLSAQHLAYVIYTSGSTGRPKGVMVEHGGISHYLQWALKAYRAVPGMTSVVSSPLAFDATITSLYLPLLSGGCATLLQENHEQEELEARLEQSERLDLIKITPAHLHMLGERIRDGKLGVQPGCFVIGGEALSPDTVALWRKLAPRSRLVNEYGPTETVVGCAIFEITQDLEPGTSVVPIGHPIANTQLYIVDRHLRPVPIGVTGELLIGGVQVARGYLNQPQLTAERFIDHPFDPAGGKVYRTGDLGRWRPDGSIEYLGRNDFQVKLRGFRIELGEIEAQLLRCAGVREAVVLAREDRPGDKRLVAYVVAQEGAKLSVPVLREALAQTLAEYMVPSAFVVLEALPLTPNGKLDRKALPAPGLEAVGARAYEAPQGEVEETLARIWAELLGVERVGRHDHFFELGGHSLMAGRMLSKVQDELDLSLEFSTVFNHPTLADFAESVLTAIVGQLSDSSDVDALIADITNR